MKKPNRKAIEKQCEKLWKKRAKERDFVCRNCQSDYVLQIHHIRSVTHTATRYDVDNAMTLCRRCHCLQKFKPEYFQDMIIDVIGQEEYDRLKKKSQAVVKHTLQDLIDIRNKLIDRTK